MAVAATTASSAATRATAAALAARKRSRDGTAVRLVVICRPPPDSAPSVKYSLLTATTPRMITPITPNASSW